MPVISQNTLISNYKVAFGRWTTVAAADVVPTGLSVCLAVVACLESDLVDDPMNVSAVPGLTTGNATLKTWKNTGGTDPTPLAATTFGKVVNWVAIGY